MAQPWYRLEQIFKRNALRWLEKFLAQRIIAPEQIPRGALKRILVIRQHDMLGDFILATPVLPALRQAFPQAHIGVLVRGYFADVVAHHAAVDEVLLFHEHGKHWTWQRVRSFYRQLRCGWDLTIVLNTVSHSLTSDLLAYFSKAKFVLGSEHRVWEGCSRNFFYHLLAPYSAEEKHQSERNLDIVRPLGVQPQSAAEVMHLTKEERDQAFIKLKEKGLAVFRVSAVAQASLAAPQSGALHTPHLRGSSPSKLVIGMHVGAGKIPNRWPIEKFAELAQRLREEHEAEVVLFWGKNEAELAEKFCASVRFAPIKIAPTSLREMAACFTHCSAMICNDTGVMHVCAAVQVPLVAIFGPTPPELWKPLGEKFLAVRGKDETTASVTVEEVWEALRRLLQASAEASN